MRRALLTPVPFLLLASAAALGCGPDTANGPTTAAGAGGSGGSSGSGEGGTTGSGEGGESTSSSSPTVTTGQGAGDPTSAQSSSASGPCTEGTILCDGNTAQVCDGNGGFSSEEDCSPGVCFAGVGCTVCAPGSGTCEGNVSTVCRADGSGFDTYTCDPEQGVTCDAGSGHCVGACAPEALGSSYIGCDYFPTVTANLVGANFNFAVAVANTSDEAANVQVHRGATLITNTAVAPNSVQIIPLPWVTELKDATQSQLIVDGAYRLRTNRPVTVYQYNPIEYTDGGFSNSFTNDASVLLPTNAWTGNYRVAARNHFNFTDPDFGGTFSYPGFYAVTALEDGTNVTVSPSATSTIVSPVGGISAQNSGTVVLNQGDVLQVLSGTTGAQPESIDVTGTLVSADKPVQVLGGHTCTFIPWNVWACDHLEESMPPLETLAAEYIVTPPLIPTGGNTPKAQMVRVVATEPGTTITYDPPQAAPGSLANAGDYFEIAQTASDFVITADKKILVSQYMQGQEAGGNSGDPAMALAVATEQYRQEYLFHAPTNYEVNYVNITAPTTATVTLDGTPVSGFVAIGSSGYGIARVPLNNGADGNHLITGTEPFGISVYGYGQYTSYWYPGGLDLDKVDVEN